MEILVIPDQGNELHEFNKKVKQVKIHTIHIHTTACTTWLILQSMLNSWVVSHYWLICLYSHLALVNDCPGTFLKSLLCAFKNPSHIIGPQKLNDLKSSMLSNFSLNWSPLKQKKDGLRYISLTKTTTLTFLPYLCLAVYPWLDHVALSSHGGLFLVILGHKIYQSIISWSCFW